MLRSNILRNFTPAQELFDLVGLGSITPVLTACSADSAMALATSEPRSPLKNSIITLDDIRRLDEIIRNYHVQHGAEYGNFYDCKEDTCVEGKWDIIYLTARAIA